MTRTPTEIVEGFIDAWNRQDFDEILETLTDDIAYHNIPMEPLHGRAAVKAYLDSIGTFDEIDWRTLHIAANGNVVLTERVDDFVLDGRRMSIPLMGVFEIRDGKIAAWRDYFDLEDYKRQRFD